jgi:hypothetical protein
MVKQPLWAPALVAGHRGHTVGHLEDAWQDTALNVLAGIVAEQDLFLPPPNIQAWSSMSFHRFVSDWGRLALFLEWPFDDDGTMNANTAGTGCSFLYPTTHAQ